MTAPTRLDSADVEAIARRVVELLAEADPPAPAPAGMLTAAEVATRHGVSRRWVYEHAEELGAVRLGGGDRPRLRFDPERVRAWAAREGDRGSEPVGSTGVEPKPGRRRAGHLATDAQLLPIRGG